MEEFLRYVVGKLIEYPDELLITRTEDGDKSVFHLAMRKTDLPKVIGKGGHTIQALRELLQASARKKGIRVGLEIIE
ncbi:MAG TPA: KH domain-containing protein [Chthoniobacterales bacterium]